MSTIDEIKSKIDIVDLVSEAGVKLRKAGRNQTGFCPFHDNKHTPSFVIWPESGTWRCFGACNEGGDIFKFVMKREGIDFKEALQKLALRAGVEVQQIQRETPQQREAYDHLRSLLEDAVVYYRSHLFNNNEILNYLRQKRGLTDSTIETFGLGYAPHGYDNLIKHFSGKYLPQDLVDAGMLSERDSGGHYDRFRNRIMIPIRDENGKMAGFGARIVDPNDIPKFLNSPETPIFTKGHLLYGLDRARKPIRAADQAVIVEGYLDVIALHQAGYENIVSPMGTALTEDQLRLLKRSTRRIVLALDPDVAGQKAVLRGLEAARSAMDKEGELGFDAHGLLRNEARLQADLRVATMPDDLDPDEIVARNKEEWATLIEQAKPIITHVMESLIIDQDINDPKIKTQIINQVLPLINDLQNSIERDFYSQKLARTLGVSENFFTDKGYTGQVVKKDRLAKRQIFDKKQDLLLALSSPRRILEKEILAFLLEEPELNHKVDRFMEEIGLKELLLQDFSFTEHQLIYKVIYDAIRQDAQDYTKYIRENIPQHLNDIYTELMNHPTIHPESKKTLSDYKAEKWFKVRSSDVMLENLLQDVIKLRKLILRENNEEINSLKNQMEVLDTEKTIIKGYDELVQQNTRLILSLDKAVLLVSRRR
ncbi:MAG: DNA primase [Anaerolineae bacterium]|nr:DNA primase [Anaerolineae bacterium]